ncbi:MAG: HpcH/HpaI aldolase/citrate lyase family protein [Gemmataceae bacterium]
MGAIIKKRLAEGKLVRVLGLGQLCSPKLIEIAGLPNFYDAVWLDQEHVGLTVSDLEEAARAARGVGLDSFARLNATDYARVMQPLEAGVGGVMAAQVQETEEAERLVQWSKFHPLGQRGVNATGVDGRYATLPLLDYFEKANEEVLVVVQIEHARAVENVEAIAAVPGVDLLFVGPADLSQSLGIPGQWDNPDLWSAVERTAAAATGNGLHWAILPLNPDHAQKCVDMGCRMISVGMDVWIVQRGFKEFLGDYHQVSL